MPTYIINLKNRADRRERVLSEFDGRDEFIPTIIEAWTFS